MRNPSAACSTQPLPPKTAPGPGPYNELMQPWHSIRRNSSHFGTIASITRFRGPRVQAMWLLKVPGNSMPEGLTRVCQLTENKMISTRRRGSK